MTGFELLSILSVGGFAIVGTGWWARNAEVSDEVRAVKFAPGLTEQHVRSLLDVVAALPIRSRVVFETSSSDGHLEFSLTASNDVISTLESALSGITPDVSLVRVEPLPRRAGQSWVLRWGRSGATSLRTDATASSSGSLLGALASTGDRETVVLRHELRPGSRAPRGATKQEVNRSEKRVGISVASQIEISTGHVARSRILLQRMLTVLRSRGVLLVQRQGPLAQLLATLNASGCLTPEELIGILGWPIDSPSLPGLAYDASPRLAPSHAIPRFRSSGSPRVFGSSNIEGSAATQIAQPTAGATTHSLIVGPSGSGKSWLMTNLIVDESATNHAIVLVDMKGDTATDVLARLNPKRHDDVVVLAPAESGPVPGLRSFGGSPELSADLWLSVFRGLFPHNFGVRSQRYLRMGIATLARSQGVTIAELPRLFQDSAFRRSLVARLDDPLLVGEWAAFEQLSVGQQSEHLLPALGKVSEVLARKSVRAVLAQSEPRITVAEAVRRKKIVVVSLPPGVIGQPAAQLLGALVIFEVWQAVMAKQSLPPHKRVHVAVYIDEPAVLGSLPIPIDTLLETARGMNCGLTLATQSLRQLPDRVAQAALTNAATIASFRASQADATMIARELPGLTSEQLQRLEPFTVALQLGLSNGTVAPVCTVRTPTLPPRKTNPQRLLRRSSALYGLDPEVVDERLRDRMQTTTPLEPPIGESGETS